MRIEEEIKQFNNDLVRSSTSQIVPIERADANRISNEGSLLRLFKCQYFNIHMLMRYLETKSQPGVIAHLVNKLHDMTRESLDLYLPQLCYLIVTKTAAAPPATGDAALDSGEQEQREKQALECAQILSKFILSISMENPNIGLRALYYFQSWSEDDHAGYAARASDCYN